MKKLIFSGLFLGLAFISQAQSAADKLIIEGYVKAKEKSDKDIANPKANVKAKTWLDRAATYESIALFALSADSSAADVATEAYKKAIELDTKNGKEGSVAKDAKAGLSGKTLHDSYIQSGAANYTAKNYKKAQGAFKMASAIDPKDSVATMYYGVASQQLDDDAGIIDAYEKHIALGGKDPIVYYALFNSFRKAKNDEKALAVLTKGIEANPDSKDLKAEKTNYYISSGKIDMAIKSLQEMVEKDPKNVNNLLNLAILHDNAATANNDKIKKLSDQINQGSGVQDKLDSKTSQVQAYTDERNRLKDQLKKQPKNADVKRRLGEAEVFLKEQTDVLNKLKEEKAAEDAKKVNVADVKSQIDALAKVRDADRSNAVTNYKKALAVEPDNYDANFNMGVMSFNEGVELKRPYDNLNPTSAEYKNNGKAMEDKFVSKFMEALPFFETAYKVKKEDEIKDNLKNLYRILKMEEKLKAMGE
jgi:tetratricopeptide (TPR) repeat protein